MVVAILLPEKALRGGVDLGGLAGEVRKLRVVGFPMKEVAVGVERGVGYGFAGAPLGKGMGIGAVGVQGDDAGEDMNEFSTASLV